MAHLIFENDRGASITDAGWHGLFTVLPPSTPAVGLFSHAFRSLNGEPSTWRLIDQPAISLVNGTSKESPTHKNLVRSDTGDVVATVGKKFSAVQPAQGYDICSSLSRDGNLVIDTCFSMCNGARWVFTCQGSSFSIGDGDTDVQVPYFVLANGNDGTMSLCGIPTTTRVVCNNTLRMALGDRLAFSFRHTGDMTAKVSEMKAALLHYYDSLADFRTKADTLSHRVWSREDRESFFLGMLEKLLGPVPQNPTEPEEHRKVSRAQDALGKIVTRFDRESAMPGLSRGSAWLAVNAVTGYIDHDMKDRSADDTTRFVRRLIDDTSALKVSVFNTALAV